MAHRYILYVVPSSAFDTQLGRPTLNFKTPNYWINKLALKSHPEGGYYSEIYTSKKTIDCVPIGGEIGLDPVPNSTSNQIRKLMTSIYFLLPGTDFSTFHRLRSDEFWHFYYGSPLELYVIDENGLLREEKLGCNVEGGRSFQAAVEGGSWFAAGVEEPSSYSLVGCVTSPGFDWKDFEVARRVDLIARYPRHEAIIVKFTKF